MNCSPNAFRGTDAHASSPHRLRIRVQYVPLPLLPVSEYSHADLFQDTPGRMDAPSISQRSCTTSGSSDRSPIQLATSQSVPSPPLQVVMMRILRAVGSISRMMSQHSSAKSRGSVLSFCNPHITTEGELRRSFTQRRSIVLKFSRNSGVSYHIWAESCVHQRMPSRSQYLPYSRLCG